MNYGPVLAAAVGIARQQALKNRPDPPDFLHCLVRYVN